MRRRGVAVALVLILVVAPAVSAWRRQQHRAEADRARLQAKIDRIRVESTTGVTTKRGVSLDGPLVWELRRALDSESVAPEDDSPGALFASAHVLEVHKVIRSKAASSGTVSLTVKGVATSSTWIRYGPLPASVFEEVHPVEIRVTDRSGEYRVVRWDEDHTNWNVSASRQTQRLQRRLALALTEDWRSNGYLSSRPSNISRDPHRHSTSLSELHELTPRAVSSIASVSANYQALGDVFIDPLPSSICYQKHSYIGNSVWDSWVLVDTSTNRALSLGEAGAWPEKWVMDDRVVTFDAVLASDYAGKSLVHYVVDLDRMKVIHAVPIGPICGQGRD